MVYKLPMFLARNTQGDLQPPGPFGPPLPPLGAEGGGLRPPAGPAAPQWGRGPH